MESNEQNNLTNKIATEARTHRTDWQLLERSGVGRLGEKGEGIKQKNRDGSFSTFTDEFKGESQESGVCYHGIPRTPCQKLQIKGHILSVRVTPVILI